MVLVEPLKNLVAKRVLACIELLILVLVVTLPDGRQCCIGHRLRGKTIMGAAALPNWHSRVGVRPLNRFGAISIAERHFVLVRVERGEQALDGRQFAPRQFAILVGVEQLEQFVRQIVGI